LHLGNNTARHYVLATLPGEMQAREIADGAAFARGLGQPFCDGLALPFGGPGTYTAETLSIAQDVGHPQCLLSTGAVQAAAPGAPDAPVHRIMPPDSAEGFLDWLQGRPIGA